jgi:transposase
VFIKGKRYTEEFKKEAVKQVTERGYSVSDVAKRLGTTTHSLSGWLKKYGEPNPRQADKADLSAENARLKADLKRMTEERDILKRPQSTLPTTPGKVRIHS